MITVALSCNCLYWTQQRSHCCDYAMNWSIRGSHPGKDERFFSSAECSDRSWHPPPLPSLLLSGYRGYFGGRGGGQSDHNVKFTFTFTLRLSLRDVDRVFFTENRRRFINNALFYIGPGFKSGFGVRFNLTKDISGFSQSHQGRYRFHR